MMSYQMRADLPHSQGANVPSGNRNYNGRIISDINMIPRPLAAGRGFPRGMNIKAENYGANTRNHYNHSDPRSQFNPENRNSGGPIFFPPPGQNMNGPLMTDYRAMPFMGGNSVFGHGQVFGVPPSHGPRNLPLLPGPPGLPPFRQGPPALLHSHVLARPNSSWQPVPKKTPALNPQIPPKQAKTKERHYGNLKWEKPKTESKLPGQLAVNGQDFTNINSVQSYGKKRKAENLLYSNVQTKLQVKNQVSGTEVNTKKTAMLNSLKESNEFVSNKSMPTTDHRDHFYGSASVQSADNAFNALHNSLQNFLGEPAHKPAASKRYIVEPSNNQIDPNFRFKIDLNEPESCVTGWNASEILKNFLYIGAGSCRSQRSLVHNPNDPTFPDQEPSRIRMDREAFVENKNIIFFLNMAGHLNQKQLRGITYPSINGRSPQVCSLAMNDVDSWPGESMVDALERGAEFINKAFYVHQQFGTKFPTLEPVKILVHCVAGVNRSAMVVVWWLARYQGLHVHDAWNLVCERRDKGAHWDGYTLGGKVPENIEQLAAKIEDNPSGYYFTDNRHERQGQHLFESGNSSCTKLASTVSMELLENSGELVVSAVPNHPFSKYIWYKKTCELLGLYIKGRWPSSEQ